MNAITTIEEIERQDVLTVFTTENGLDPYLSLIRSEIESFVPNMTTAKGRAEIASMARKVAKSKTYLDDIGKELVAKLKEQPKLVDAERKRMRDLLDAWRDEVRKPLTDYENAEAKRVADLKERLLAFKLNPDVVSSMLIEGQKGLLASIEAIAIDDTWEEFAGEAGKLKDAAINAMKEFIRVRMEAEARKAEIDRLRAEKEEIERRAREERIAREAEERGRIEAERKAAAEVQAAAIREQQAKQAVERAQREKAAAEAQAKAEAARAEIVARAKIEDEQKRRAAEEQQRKANLEHRKACVEEAIADLRHNVEISDAQAQAIIESIEFGAIRHIRMDF